MTRFDVHLYREHLLFFPSVTAATPAGAAAVAARTPTERAMAVDDRDGRNIAALVDVVGDDDHCQSVLIDFEAASAHPAAGLSAALVRVTAAADDLDAALDGVSDQSDDARAALTAACRTARETMARCGGPAADAAPAGG